MTIGKTWQEKWKAKRNRPRFDSNIPMTLEGRNGKICKAYHRKGTKGDQPPPLDDPGEGLPDEDPPGEWPQPNDPPGDMPPNNSPGGVPTPDDPPGGMPQQQYFRARPSWGRSTMTPNRYGPQRGPWGPSMSPYGYGPCWSPYPTTDYKYGPRHGQWGSW